MDINIHINDKLRAERFVVTKYLSFISDWGFNPFHVTDWVAELMTDLAVKGELDLETSGATYTTLGGRQLEVEVRGENVYTAGARVLGSLELPAGTVLFLDTLPWVDHDIVDQLASNNR